MNSGKSPGSGDDFSDGRTEIDLQALVAGDFQLVRIEPQLMEHGGMNIRHVVAVLHGMEAEFVGGAVSDSALEAAAGHQRGEAERMMIAALAVALHARSAAELAAHDDNRFV